MKTLKSNKKTGEIPWMMFVSKFSSSIFANELISGHVFPVQPDGFV